MGVTVNQAPIETIRLQVAAESVEYLRTKPIHHSQREADETGTVVTLKLVPNFELLQAILQYGPSIEVLEPETFRREIGKKSLEMSTMYSD